LFTQYEAGYKAAGVGNIETEHLVYAHPGLCVLLSLLFNCIWWFIAGYHTDCGCCTISKRK